MGTVSINSSYPNSGSGLLLVKMDIYGSIIWTRYLGRHGRDSNGSLSYLSVSDSTYTYFPSLSCSLVVNSNYIIVSTSTEIPERTTYDSNPIVAYLNTDGTYTGECNSFIYSDPGVTANSISATVYSTSWTDSSSSLTFNTTTSNSFTTWDGATATTTWVPTTFWTFDRTGNLRLPTNSLNIYYASGASANIAQWVTAPATRTSTGTAGQMAYDSGGNLYICYTANNWSKFTGNITW